MDQHSMSSVPGKPSYTRHTATMAYVALALAIVGLVLCWSPVVGIAHALAGTILGAMHYRCSRCRISLYAIIVGIVATMASIVLSVIEIGSIELVDTYDASPWM